MSVRASAGRPALAIGVLLAVVVLAACGNDDVPGDPERQLEALPGADVDAGREAMVTYGCNTCHVIPGVRDAVGHVGPPLNWYAYREYIAGVIPNTAENLVLWLIDPQSINPETAMPATGLSEEEAWAIVGYLSTLD